MTLAWRCSCSPPKFSTHLFRDIVLSASVFWLFLPIDAVSTPYSYQRSSRRHDTLFISTLFTSTRHLIHITALHVDTTPYSYHRSSRRHDTLFISTLFTSTRHLIHITALHVDMPFVLTVLLLTLSTLQSATCISYRTPFDPVQNATSTAPECISASMCFVASCELPNTLSAAECHISSYRMFYLLYTTRSPIWIVSTYGHSYPQLPNSTPGSTEYVLVA
jgi:hypothetical protein